VLAIAGLAPAASASVVENYAGRDTGGRPVLRYLAGPEANRATIVGVSTLGGTSQSAVLTDTGVAAPISVRGCAPLAFGAMCSAAAYLDDQPEAGAPVGVLGLWASASLQLASGDDEVAVRGLQLAEFTHVDAAEGDDRIDVLNDTHESIFCGPGADTVTANHSDFVSADCETVVAG
jgi:hypothetical protein